MKNRFLSLLLTVFYFVYPIYSQIVTNCNPPYDDATELVGILVNGVPFSNASMIGFDCAAGYFDGAASNVDLESGLVMCTGGVGLVEPGGTSNTGGGSVEDDLVLQLEMVNSSATNVNNVVVLEFDFEPNSDQIAFQYVFASEEYPGYTCSNFNDIFGFFLSGPGINGPFDNNAINIAMVPDPDNPGNFTDTPVMINTINSGSPSGGNSGPCDQIDENWSDYSVFFTENSSEETVNMPGFTVPLTATATVIPCETYHIKLALANVSDQALQSAVFLLENSFSSVGNSIVTGSDYAPWIGNDTTLVEGCFDGSLTFGLTEAIESDYVINYQLSGTAEDGVDYEEIGNQAIIPAGMTSVSIPIVPIYDALVEEDETISLQATISDGCTEELQEFNFVIVDRQEMYLDLPGDTAFCPEDPPILVDPYISGGIEPFTYQWMYNGALLTNQEQIVISDDNIGYYFFEADGLCGSHVEGSFETSILEPAEPLAIFNTYNRKELCMGDVLRTNVQLNGGIGDLHYHWTLNGLPYTDTLNFEIATDIPFDYHLRLDVADDCHNHVYEEIDISVMDCFIPNVFSPNNDRENDYWYINFGEVVENVRIDIFNRWGQLVYMNSHYEQCDEKTGDYCWDGTDHLTNENCPEGTYYYKIEMSDGRKYSGTFDLFR